MITVNGDQATVVPILEGPTRPTAIEPAGDTLWAGDRAKDMAIPMPKSPADGPRKSSLARVGRQGTLDRVAR
jgi:hypothetical protein